MFSKKVAVKKSKAVAAKAVAESIVCTLCNGSGLTDQNTLCVPCEGSGQA